jgi:hypothetical protein
MLSLPEPGTRPGALIDLLAFAGTIAAALLFDWKTADLVWGLWLSSLIVGYALIVYGIWSSASRMGAGGGGALLVAGIGALFTLAFFTFHFGMFHLVHGVFLWTFFPLSNDPNRSLFGYLSHFGQIWHIGWPLVLGSLISNRDAFAAARASFQPSTPYRNVIRMHLLIFVFAFAHAAHLDRRWLMVAVLFFYYFPIGSLRALVSPTPASS